MISACRVVVYFLFVTVHLLTYALDLRLQLITKNPISLIFRSIIEISVRQHQNLPDERAVVYTLARNDEKALYWQTVPR